MSANYIKCISRGDWAAKILHEMLYRIINYQKATGSAGNTTSFVKEINTAQGIGNLGNSR